MKEKFHGFLLTDFHCLPIGIDTLDSHFSFVADFISVCPLDLVTLVFEKADKGLIEEHERTEVKK